MDFTQDNRSPLNPDLNKHSTSSIWFFCRAPVILSEFEPRFQISVQCGKSTPPKYICGRCEFQRRMANQTIFMYPPRSSGTLPHYAPLPVSDAKTKPFIPTNTCTTAPVQNDSLHSTAYKFLRSTNFSDWREFRNSSNVSVSNAEVSNPVASMHAELTCIISSLREEVDLLSRLQAQNFSLLETQNSQLLTLIDTKFYVKTPEAPSSEKTMETKPEAVAANDSAVFEAALKEFNFDEFAATVMKAPLQRRAKLLKTGSPFRDRVKEARRMRAHAALAKSAFRDGRQAAWINACRVSDEVACNEAHADNRELASSDNPLDFSDEDDRFPKVGTQEVV